jgi:hydroxymethylpyrimidine/phosphomethylpyrimidine kinase
VRAQIEAVLTDINVDAIKIGMLFSPELVTTVAQSIKDFSGTVILDPVMIAKSGDKLLQDDAIAALIDELVPRAQLLTPNLPEAETLLGINAEEKAPEQLTEGLHELGAKNVLIKGGHAHGNQCIDLLSCADHGTPMTLSAPRIQTKNTHGTGCTYSASIAAFCAQGYRLADAVAQAHQYLHRAIATADTLTIGHGHGPVHHFHSYWAQRTSLATNPGTGR